MGALKRTIEIARLSIATLLVSTMFPAQGWAGTIEIDPISLDINQARTTTTLRIKNNADTPLVMRTEALAWDQRNGEDSYSPTKDLIISPPIFTIAAGQTQIVRVGLRRETWQPVAYRVVAEEVPAIRPGTVQVALKFNLPLLKNIAEASPAGLSWLLQQYADGRWVLEAANNLPDAVRVSAADVADATGLSEDIPIRFGTILPNSRKQWILGGQPKIKDPVRFAELAKKTQNVRITNLR